MFVLFFSFVCFILYLVKKKEHLFVFIYKKHVTTILAPVSIFESHLLYNKEITCTITHLHANREVQSTKCVQSFRTVVDSSSNPGKQKHCL